MNDGAEVEGHINYGTHPRIHSQLQLAYTCSALEVGLVFGRGELRTETLIALLVVDPMHKHMP